ncbi:MAG TPA: serine/threonine-protein kinase [Gemmataceae bacterium]|nr:serine/threonine-protein kinase [Gemmataceae bacterium]
MAADPSTHGELDATLLQAFADMERHLQAGQAWDSDAFLADHPNLTSNPERAVDLILHEYFLRRRLGEALEPQTWFQRFPRWQEQLIRRLQTQQTVGGPADGVDHNAQTESHAGASSSAFEEGIPELGRHEIHEEIGRGGMGVVYRALDLILNRPVALKMIVPRHGLLETPEAVQRFYREARAAARLRHPHIIPIHGMGLHQGRHCFTMPLLTGTLSGRTAAFRGDARAAVTLVEKIARAVQYAHEQGVIHRDLKPANILLDEKGEPLVADFGLAKVLDAEGDSSSPGQRVGTPSYMSPEQAAGHTWEVSPRSDVWALGVILYELLTGARPFQEATPEGIYKQVMIGQPPPPRMHCRDLPPELEKIVLKCLQKDPAGRYAAAGEVADDLARWLRGEPVSPDGAATVRSAAAPPRRRRRIVVAVAAGFFLAGLAAAFSLWFFNPDRPLWDVQARLRRGEAVQLIPMAGMPTWWRWATADTNAKALIGPEGAFEVDGWPYTLVELLPDTCGHDRYLIHGQIRHLRCGDGGSVGLTFVGTSDRAGNETVRSFLRLEFNDVQDAVDQWNRVWADGQLQKKLQVDPPAKPAGNTVTISLVHDLIDSGIRDRYDAIKSTECFSAAGHSGQPGAWRTIEIRVTPKQIVVFWEGTAVVQKKPAEAENDNGRFIARLRRLDPNDPGLQRLAAPLALRGGVGLYLNKSQACFRDFRIQPLAADDNE